MDSLNLRRSIISRYWQKKSPRVARVIGLMESMEDWMVDDHEPVARSLDKMAKRLEKSGPSDILNQTDNLLEVMAYMSTGKVLAIIDWLEVKYEGRVSLRILDYAKQKEGSIPAQLLIERVRTLETLELLPQVFSPTRINFVRQIIQQMETGGEKGEQGRGEQGKSQDQ